MARSGIFLAMGIFAVSTCEALAQPVCAAPPIVANESVRLKLETTAKSRIEGRYNNSFSSALEKDRTDIFSKYPDGARAVAYYQYVVCALLHDDQSIPVSQKIEYMNKAFSALFAGSAKSYSQYYFLVLNTYGGEKTIVKSLLNRDGDHWLEIQLGKVVFVWKEISRNDNYIFIIHEPRRLQIKIPVSGGISLMGYVGEDWQTWNEMHPVQ